MRPDTYKEQSGCHSCRHVFVLVDHGDPLRLYCALDADKRPPCMSSAMDECPGLYDKDQSTYAAAYHAWKEWSAGRYVEARGICERYEQ